MELNQNTLLPNRPSTIINESHYSLPRPSNEPHYSQPRPGGVASPYSQSMVANAASFLPSPSLDTRPSASYDSMAAISRELAQFRSQQSSASGHSSSAYSEAGSPVRMRQLDGLGLPGFLSTHVSPSSSTLGGSSESNEPTVAGVQSYSLFR